ncbi:MAG TPA: hypothetical protein VKV95_15720 [Terriglobia bacterium]|nr:hypothetical protein [Terriglobia bacterium]
MNKQNPFEKIIMGALVLMISAIGMCAQEPPPPPPGGPSGDVFFFNRMEEASSAKNVKGAPYSAVAVTEMNQTLSDGNQIHHTTSANLYRDTEGRTRREQALGGFGPWSVPANKARQIIRISDPVAGVNYVLDPNQRTAQQLPAMGGGRGKMFRERNSPSGAPLPPGQGERRFRMAPPPPEGAGGSGGVSSDGSPEGATVQTESLGSQVIEGVQADGTRKTVTIPAGSIGNEKPIQIVTERWYSNQLQAVVMSKRTDPRVGETIYRLTNISQAEPAAALFQVPAGYTVQDAPPFQRHSLEAKPKTN